MEAAGLRLSGAARRARLAKPGGGPPTRSGGPLSFGVLSTSSGSCTPTHGTLRARSSLPATSIGRLARNHYACARRRRPRGSLGDQGRDKELARPPSALTVRISALHNKKFG